MLRVLRDDPVLRFAACAAVVLGMWLGAFLVACGRGALPRVVQLAAQDCVEIARADGRGDVQKLCATLEELAPLLQLIALRRTAAAASAGGSEEACFEIAWVERAGTKASSLCLTSAQADALLSSARKVGK